MKKRLLILLVIALTITWGVRFYIVNKDVDSPIIQVFQKGVEVPIEKDFFYSSDEDMDGYTVTVLDADLVPAEEFLQGYDAGDQAELLGNFTDYIYVVRVSIANQYNPFVDEKGIDAGGYYLIGTDYILGLDDTCYYLANPDMPGTTFSLQQESSMELILPFTVMSDLTSHKHILEDPPKLQITLYPSKKLIELY